MPSLAFRLVGPASRSKSAIAMLSAALPPSALTGAMIACYALTSLKRKRRPEFAGCPRLLLRLVGPASRSTFGIAIWPVPRLGGGNRSRRVVNADRVLAQRPVGPFRSVGQRSATHRSRADLCPRGRSPRGRTHARGWRLRPSGPRTGARGHVRPSPALARRCNLARAEAQRWQPEHIADRFERLFKSLNRHAPDNAGT